MSYKALLSPETLPLPNINVDEVSRAKEKIDPNEHLDLLKVCAKMMITGQGLGSSSPFRGAIQHYKTALGNGSLAEFGDLVNQGYFGLRQAARTYDPTLGASFGTHALIRIASSVNRTVLNRINMSISMPARGFEDYLRDGKSLPSCVSNDFVPDDIDFEEDDHSGSPLSENDLALMPIHDEPDIEAEKSFEAVESAHYVSELMAGASLSTRENRLLKLRFGLEDDKSRTLEEIGREFNVTRERIRQIESNALEKLRKVAQKKAFTEIQKTKTK